jgi:hypothetical protein
MYHISKGCLVGLLLLSWVSPVQAQREELIKYLQSLPVKDYLELDEEQSLGLSQKLLPLRSDSFYGTPKLIFRKSLYVQHDWIIVEIRQIMSIRGASFAFIHFIDENGTFTHTEKFSIGYRNYFHSLRVSKHPNIRDYCIEIHSGGYRPIEVPHLKAELSTTAYEQARIQQTYAFHNNTVKLIRLTNFEGEHLPNIYLHDNLRIGPLPQFTSKEIQQALDSKDTVALLEVMCWLSGIHREGNIKSYRPNPADQETEEFLRVTRLKLERIQADTPFMTRDMARFALYRLSK